jgi:hypothetical protein
MHKVLDITGQRYGLLVALKRQGRDHRGIALWECICDCGGIVIVRLGNLRSGNSKSCGCFHSPRTHGQARKNARTRSYRTWDAMIDRCRNPHSTSYYLYGGRGIAVCERWETFEGFFADMGEKPIGLSLDRTNNNGNYEKANCRWATSSQQNKNRRPRARRSPRSAKGQTL